MRIGIGIGENDSKCKGNLLWLLNLRKEKVDNIVIAVLLLCLSCSTWRNALLVRVLLVYCDSGDPFLDSSNNISAASLVELSMSATAAETGLVCMLLLWVLLPELIVLEKLSIFKVSIFGALEGRGGFSFTVRQRGSTGCGPGNPILQKVNELKKRRSTGCCSGNKSPLKINI